MLGSFDRLWYNNRTDAVVAQLAEQLIRRYNNRTDAVVAQLAEQLIRNEQVAGSIPVNGSIFCCLFFILCFWGAANKV